MLSSKLPILCLSLLFVVFSSCDSHKEDEFQLDYIVRPARAAKAKSPLLILLHGRGSNEMDMYGVAKLIDERFTVLCPRGIDSIGLEAYSWFPLEKREAAYFADTLALKEVSLRIEGLVNELKGNFKYDDQQIIVAGFSQGAMLASKIYAQDYILGLKGLVSIGGANLNKSTDRTVRSSKSRALLIHSKNDAIVPYANTTDLRKYLENKDVDVELFTQEIGHSLDRSSIEAINRWLKAY